MASIDARVKKLEKQVTALKKALAREKLVSAASLQKHKDVEKWIKLQVKWSKEVTEMLRQVNWAAIAKAYPGGGGGNPPQTPPDWPVD